MHAARATNGPHTHSAGRYSDTVELSQMKAFVAVSRARTIAAAADSLRVTPSPLSRTIRELERQLGGALFDRKYHEFDRTPLGDVLLPLAVEVVRQADELIVRAEGRAMPFRFGATPWTSKMLTQTLSNLVGSASPGAAFQSDLSSALLESIRHGDLDLALVHLPVSDAGLSAVPLRRYRYAVIAMDDGALDLGRPLRLADLEGKDLLSLPLMMQPASMQAFLDALNKGGVASITEVDLRDVIGLQSRMARTGEVMLGTTSPDLPTGRMFDLESMHVYPLGDDEIDFEIGLAWRTRDTIHGPLVASIVDAMRPPTGAVPFLD